MAVIERGIIDAGLRIKKRIPCPTLDATGWTVARDGAPDFIVALSGATLRTANPEHLRDMVVEKFLYAVNHV